MTTLTPYQRSLSQADVDCLCTAAAAWRCAGPRTRQVCFVWRHKRFRSTLSTFRMLVRTHPGEPVAFRWH